MDNKIIWITYKGRRIPIKPGMKGKFKKKETKELLEKNAKTTLERTKELYENTPTEQKYKEFKKAQKEYDELHKNNNDIKKINEISNNNWREQIKRNNEETDRITKDLEQQRGKGKYQFNQKQWEDDYYGAFRENERRNALIKVEKPEELYENVDAYAGYYDKSWKLSGSQRDSDGNVIKWGEKNWTGKEYTNDEFMEHLTDSNWHKERKMLEEAKLTNQELNYIKNKTTLSQFGVGEELTGTENVNKMIREAKQQFSKDKSFSKKYEGSINYLQKNTNLSYAQIIELLKKIEKEKK